MWHRKMVTLMLHMIGSFWKIYITFHSNKTNTDEEIRISAGIVSKLMLYIE
jgi:hypothetical protein